MEFEIKRENDRGYTLITTSGKTTVEGFKRLTVAMDEAGLSSPGSRILLDYRGLNSLHVTAREIREMVESMPNPDVGGVGVRMATLVETDLGFGLVRMWDSYVGHRLQSSHRVFRSFEKAELWLLSETETGGDE